MLIIPDLAPGQYRGSMTELLNGAKGGTRTHTGIAH
ncbi:MAG: hypothetical protein CI949_4144, partial [Halanaerobium sp.]